jgi:transposase
MDPSRLKRGSPVPLINLKLKVGCSVPNRLRCGSDTATKLAKVDTLAALCALSKSLFTIFCMSDNGRMRKTLYPSDISRKQYEQIRVLLESTRKQTKPRTVDLYEVFCAVLYVLKSGCQWRMLPGEFPKWRTVHSYFAQWSKSDEGGKSVLERALKKSGWRGPYQTGAQRMHEFLDR